MIRILTYLLLIVVGNLLTLEFAFTQSSQRYIALLGFLVVVFSILKLPFVIAESYTGLKLKISEMNSENMKKDKLIAKHSNITGITLILLLSLNIGLFIKFFNHEETSLYENGKLILTVVDDRKWEGRGKSRTFGHYIYYKYKIRDKTYKHNTKNDSFIVGDTLKILYHPENPDNHVIMNLNNNK